MYNYEKIAEACKGFIIGNVYKTNEITDFVSNITRIDKKNILPSDYCYNKTNKGADGDRFQTWPRLFEYVEYETYRYLGEGYPYTGSVIYSKSKKKYGTWRKGVFEEE